MASPASARPRSPPARLGPGIERVDPETGEVVATGMVVLPTHYKCPQSGAVLPVEDPSRWRYTEDDEP